MHLDPKPNVENFPEVRSLTPVEKTVVRRFIYEQWGVYVFFASMVVFMAGATVSVDIILGGEFIFITIPFLVVFFIVYICIIIYLCNRKENMMRRLGGPVREARGVLRAKQPTGSLGSFPMMHGRELLVPIAWHDELPRLRQVYTLVFPVSDDIWVPVEMNGWLSLERDANAGVFDTWLPPGRVQLMNPLSMLRIRKHKKRYRRLRKKERKGQLRDAYTSTEEARSL